MKSFQNPRDAAANAPAPPTKNPSPSLRLHAAAPTTRRRTLNTRQASTRQPAELRLTFLINGQIIRIHRKQLKTNNRDHF
jgi:hypothetical protein